MSPVIWNIGFVEMHVRPIRVLTAVMVAGGLLANGGQARAQACTSNAGLSKNISGTNMSTLLTGNYACANISPTEHWNELHNGTQVLDYKKGPTDPVDPSDTPSHPTGTYTITGTDTGIVTYYYPASAPFAYTIKGNEGATAPSPGAYSFCTTGGGLNLLVTIQASHC